MIDDFNKKKNFFVDYCFSTRCNNCIFCISPHPLPLLPSQCSELRFLNEVIRNPFISPDREQEVELNRIVTRILNETEFEIDE